MSRIFERGEMGALMYAEGNFINDCSFKWHLLTRGNKNHWRNFVPSTFYCTHSIGPLMYTTGTARTPPSPPEAIFCPPARADLSWPTTPFTSASARNLTPPR